ncbi:MAG: LysR family transcriptional regulator [Pseudomonadota bacterium]
MDTTIEVLELKALASVVERGSFTAAADSLKTDKAHVSRIVSRLEKKLNAQLLQRSTRRLNVTEVGREFYERAAGILAALEETEASVAQSMGTPTGSLKITAGPEYGVLVVNTWITEYLKTFPKVRVQAEFTNRVTDIIHEGFDVAIRIGPLRDSELSARKLGEIDYSFYASPDYLEARKTPPTPEALQEHDLVMFAPRGTAQWKVVNKRDVRTIAAEPRFQVNNNIAAMDMAAAGMGITLLPRFMAASHVDEGALRPILKDWAPIPVPVHAVFASSRYMAPKVRSFVDLAVASLK